MSIVELAIPRAARSENNVVRGVPSGGGRRWGPPTVPDLELLEVAKEMAKVDVKEHAVLLDHDVVVVPIADAEDVGRHAVRGTRRLEVVDRLGVGRLGSVRCCVDGGWSGSQARVTCTGCREQVAVGGSRRQREFAAACV